MNSKMRKRGGNVFGSLEVIEVLSLVGVVIANQGCEEVNLGLVDSGVGHGESSGGQKSNNGELHV